MSLHLRREFDLISHALCECDLTSGVLCDCDLTSCTIATSTARSRCDWFGLECCGEACSFIQAIYIYIHIHTYPHTHTHTQTHTHTHTHTHLHTHTHIHTHTHTHTHTHAHTLFLGVCGSSAPWIHARLVSVLCPLALFLLLVFGMG